jgi:hypothetical protein
MGDINMMIDFLPVLENSKTIKLYDITPLGQSLPPNIYSYSLRIQGSRLPSTAISNSFDIINYLRLQRIQTEIFTIKSEHLGLDNNINIPDGVYHFFIEINNNIKKETIFVVYKEIDDKINQLLEDSSYNVKIGDYDVSYVGDSVKVKYDIETVRLAVVLRDTLISAANNKDEVLVNDTLDKLNRLLEILN